MSNDGCIGVGENNLHTFPENLRQTINTTEIHNLRVKVYLGSNQLIINNYTKQDFEEVCQHGSQSFCRR